MLGGQVIQPVFGSFRTEAHVIEEITSTVWKSLNREFLHVEKNFVGMDRRASSTCTSTGSWDYEVCLSFKGEDTRYNFTDHLYAALYQKGIITFRLDEIRGEEVASALFKAIEKSRCILVVLSKYFAHSGWFLDELVKIMECRNQNGKVILPVFYHVDPSDVRKEEGGLKTQSHADETQDRRPNFLDETSKSEADYIEDITRVILMRFSHKLLQIDKNLIGMDYHLEEMEEIFPWMMDSISNDVRMGGIYGLGGIGFEKSGLLHLQKKLLHDILPRRKNFISTIDEGIYMIKNRLCFKKVLLVLDDVDDLNQLEALAGDHNWFGPGSRIIVTTRDKHLLEVYEVDTLYEAKKLDHKEIFLDVACFFNGEDKDFVTRILEACNFYAESGIRVLGDKCLISIVDNKIWMHDLLQQMGQDIVGQEFPEEPGKWSRLCYTDVVNQVDGKFSQLDRGKDKIGGGKSVADPTGVRFMHCHVEQHLIWGMETAFIVKNGKHLEAQMLSPPSHMPSC
ncbi:hypothetical protein AAG906_018864 [Vitis piasezkii]